MTVYQSPWARKWKRTQVVRTVSHALFVATGNLLTGLIIMSALVYGLITCVEREATITATIRERSRIAAELTQEPVRQAKYVAYMERLGRGDK